MRKETICSSKKGRGDCLEVVKCNGRQFNFKGFDKAEPAIQRCSYKNVLCSKFTGEHPRRSIKLHCNFIDITLRQGCSPVNLLHVFRTLFPMNTSGRLILTKILFPAADTTAGPEKNMAYEYVITVVQQAKEYLSWWIVNMKICKGKSLLIVPQDLTIFLDASKKGWGASCQVITTGIRWSSVKKAWHINALELEGSQLFHLQNSKI